MAKTLKGRSLQRGVWIKLAMDVRLWRTDTCKTLRAGHVHAISTQSERGGHAVIEASFHAHVILVAGARGVRRGFSKCDSEGR